MRRVAQLARMLDRQDRDEAVLGGTIATAAGPIHYLADGPKTALPIILLHGASGNLRDWSSSIQPLLARRGLTIALDRPGLGHSRPSRGPVWLLGTQTEALRDAVNQMGHCRYVLVGHSYSGALALDWTLRYPDQVAGVCLLAGAAMDWGAPISGHYRVSGLPLIGRLVSRMAPLIATERRIQATLDEIFAPQEVPPFYRAAAGVELALRPRSFYVNARAVQQLRVQIAENQRLYPTIGCPVELLHGAEDVIVPPHVHSEPLSRLLPDAMLTILPGIGHMPHHVAQQETVGVITRLIGRIKSAATIRT